MDEECAAPLACPYPVPRMLLLFAKKVPFASAFALPLPDHLLHLLHPNQPPSLQRFPLEMTNG
jgi:hypothetical protein